MQIADCAIILPHDLTAFPGIAAEVVTKLSLGTFISAGTDLELSKYRVLSGLRSYRDDFSQNRLYPGLAQLIELLGTLEGLLEHRADLQKHLPQQLTGIDLETKNLIYESAKPLRDIDHVIELIEWSLPVIRETIDEGGRIYDFVDDSMVVEHVGIMPMYREEGYCFVPENRAAVLHVLRYEVSLFRAGEEKFRTLKTRPIRALKQSIILSSLEALKLQLIAEFRDLPTPATFMCDTDLDFPFAETILPVAKRKLMARVFA